MIFHVISNFQIFLFNLFAFRIRSLLYVLLFSLLVNLFGLLHLCFIFSVQEVAYNDYDTDFDTETLPTQVLKTVNKKENGTTYKINKNTQVRVGSGGRLFKFETLNGNIYIKKQS